MDLFEKVEKGLECCWPETEGMEACAECPYNGGTQPPDCDQFSMMKDCLSVIREQQKRIKELQTAHVMTLEEVKAAGVIWIEKAGVCVQAIKVRTLEDGKMLFVYAYEEYLYTFSIIPKYYGKAYRCWTLPPTDEQRKEAE